MPFVGAKEPTPAEQVLELLKKNQPMSEPDQPPFSDYKYWAFISYSHQDNLATRGDGGGDHIRWANWLHEQLETFLIPDGYRDRPTRSGEPMPERFFPTFRDEAELAHQPRPRRADSRCAQPLPLPHRHRLPALRPLVLRE